MYDTHLSPAQETRYRIAATLAGRINDTKNYDLRGAWLKDPQSITKSGHLSDEFKKPNHPTFSNESKYSTTTNPGGSWVPGKQKSWSFTPSPKQISRAGGLAPFKKYFNQNEKGQNSGLVIPPSYN